MSGYLRDAGVDVNQTRTAYQELQQLGSQYGELVADGALAGASMAPPPFGTAADLASIGKSLWGGTWGDVLFDTIGLVPLFGDGIKGGRLLNKVNDIRKALDVGHTAMGRVFNKTKEAAGKYWDDLVSANRAKYDNAIKGCGNNKACREGKAHLKGPQYNNAPKSGPNGEWEGERGDGVWKPSNGGPPITYKNGFPDYSDHATQSVEIPMTGKRSFDERVARDAVREQLRDPTWKKPKGYTWHHKEDGVTMELVPTNVHATGQGASTPHRGGASLYDAAGNPNSEF